MTGSREAVLARIRAALVGDDPDSSRIIPRGYQRRGDHVAGSAQVLDLMVDRLVDYRAIVHRVSPGDVPTVLDEALRAARTVVVPPGLPNQLTQACSRSGRAVTRDGDPYPLSPNELDGIDAVVTRARIGIALSGTIILDGQDDQGRRAITLIPDHHIVVLDAEQIVETVPEAIAMLEPTRPLTMIAGPSATSDIELERVEGVHGPRTLEVVLVE